MKILAVGGSYFLGRVFTMLAAMSHQVTLLNRGTYSLQELGVREWHADRRDRAALSRIGAEDFDVIVDFCAYRQGDIQTLLEGLGCRARQYLLVSTVDVYEKWTGRPLTEEAPLESRRFGGENGEYIWQKLLLERELKEVCGQRHMAWTAVRPAILYGPFNYAMREAGFVQLAVSGQEILCPQDAPGRFQPVYVKDAAAMMLALCAKEAAFDGAYNLAGEPVDYPAFLEALAQAADRPVAIRYLPYQEAAARNAFLPFPVAQEETEYYDGSKILRETGLSYTPLKAGLEKVWNSFAPLFAGQ